MAAYFLQGAIISVWDATRNIW
ncbi:protein of unknown function [Cupriavidus taiwanensis]|nr:protein of unknown function [Cupriavidus taiwanensis]